MFGELWTSKRIFKYLCGKNKKYKYCARVRKYHLKVFRMVNSILFRYDPIGIKRYGVHYECIEDEYFSEATRISLKVDLWDSVENLTAIIKKIMDYSFAEDFSIEYCTLIAREIWNGRRQQMKFSREFYMEDIMFTRVWETPIVIEVD